MASREPRGLGKGLSALLGEAADIDKLRKPVGYVNKEIVGERKNETVTESADIVRIPIDLISPNPFQPRMSFDGEALEELAASIRSLGLIQPITVRKTEDGKYQIISGERRYRACRIAGMDMIPAYIRSASKQGMLEMAIVENIQRENLDPIETALSYQRLIDECDLTQEQMALRVGKKRASITNYLRLLKLPDKVQHDLKVGLLSVGHAKVILGVEDPVMQQKLCDLVIKEDLSVRQLEDRLKTPAKPEEKKDSADTQRLPDEYYKMLEHIGKFFGDRISLKRNASGKGSMTVKFNSDEEVRKFIEAMEKAGL
jgi:ParB family transcriptional regulator, chromosome partitioning protein